MKDSEEINFYDLLSICPICKKHFCEGDRTTVIRDTKYTFLIAHSRCFKFYEKTKKNTESLIPNSDNYCNESDFKLWRYMDLGKFVSMLKSGALFFSSPKNFKDVYEGAYGELDNKSKWDTYYSRFFRTSIITAPDNCWHSTDVEKTENTIAQLVQQLSSKRDYGIFINCWHKNEFESEAMWNVYSSSVDNAIAIQTTYKILKKELENKARIEPVKYIDYSTSFADINNAFLYKRKSFEFEQEVRAYISQFDKTKTDGIEVKVNLNSIIENVYVSPYSPGWFEGIVEDLVSRYGYSFNVQKSTMTKIPF